MSAAGCTASSILGSFVGVSMVVVGGGGVAGVGVVVGGGVVVVDMGSVVVGGLEAPADTGTYTALAADEGPSCVRGGS